MTVLDLPSVGSIALFTQSVIELKGGKTMFRKDKPELDEVIDEVISTLRDQDPSDEKFAASVDNLEKLVDIKNKKNNKLKLNPNDILKVAAYVGGLILILEYEQLRVISSKAFNHLVRIF